MTSAPILDAYPLAPLQLGMLQNELRMPGTGIDLEQLVLALHEPVDPQRLRQAWIEATRRHPILRTGFRWADVDVPLQEVHVEAEPVWEAHDWGARDDVDAEAAFEAFLAADRLRGFDLSRPPLQRLNLFRFAEVDHRLVWTFPHALLDGRSFHLVLQEVFEAYDAAGRGEAFAAPVRPPFRDHIDWLQRRDFAASQPFWRDLLRGFDAPNALDCGPFAPEPTVSPHLVGHGSRSIVLAPALGARLKAFAERHALTLNTLLSGAWAILLARQSESEEVVFGTTRACRHTGVEGAERMVGLLMNTVPMRVSLAGDPALVPWLQAMRAQHVAAREHEHTPLALIRSWSDVDPHLPLFESLVVFENYTMDQRMRARGGAWAHRALRTLRKPNLPLTLAGLGGDSIRLELLYDETRFAATMIGDMLDRLQVLLCAIADGDRARLRDLAWYPASEDARIARWNGNSASFPRDRPVHALIRAHAERAPERIALICGDARIDYAALEARATRFARRLRSHGVGPETLVGVCAPRGIATVVALLAVLKAGGAYVPIDPRQPQARILALLADAGIRVLVAADATLREAVPAAVAALALDEAVGAIHAGNGAPTEPTAPTTAPEDPDVDDETMLRRLAYVLYTSGSTGAPKGVMIEHAALLNLVHWHVSAFRLTSDDRIPQVANLAFDAAGWEIWPCLAVGATLHLAEPQHASPEALRDWFVAEELTIGFLPTPLAEAVLALPWPAHTALRTLLTGGDALRVWPSADLPFTLVNNYGPTENTVVSTSVVVAPAWPADPWPRIGFPIANVSAQVRDGDDRPLPVGVTGELHVAGRGVARGYLGRPALTAERFVPDPDGPPGSRRYRTGDRVRWTAQGGLDYLGRVDRQIKLRGYRIEPGEIEAALLRHPCVREVAVSLWHGPAGPQLAAYVAGDTTAAPMEALRAHLRECLPAYMVPDVWVALAALPLTPNGKIDRGALPEPSSAAAPPGADGLARMPIEELLAGIWSDVLGAVGRVHRGSHFFELGGHSLLAMQVATRIGQVFGIAAPVHACLAYPVLSELATRIDAEMRRDGASAPPPLVRLEPDAEKPLSFAQERMYFLHQFEPESWDYNVPYALRIEGALEVAVLERALSDIVSRHEVLRTRYAVESGRPVQRLMPATTLSLPLMDLSTLSLPERESRLASLLQSQARAPFDLGVSPLRMALVRLRADDHVLVLVMHHIVSDAWSMEVVARELSALYGSYRAGEPSPLPALPIQYGDYAAWQRDWLQGEVLQSQLAYWRTRLSGVPTLELPTRGPRPAQLMRAGGHHDVSLPPGLVASLRALGRETGTTLFMTVLAAFNVLLYRYTGQEDIAVGTPVSGRSRVETEGLIGCFLNTLVMRSDLSGDPGFRTLLSRVRETSLEAYAHQDLPFEKLVEELQPRRDLSRTPLFQVMLVVQHAPQQGWELAELRLRAGLVEAESSKFDLTLTVREEGDGAHAQFRYGTALFDAETIARMGAHFVRLLEAVVADPQARIGSLPLLGESERRQLLETWNDTARPYPRDALVHDLFAAQARRTPSHAAVVYGDATLDYATLDAESNRLAHYLRAEGVAAESRVGICMERGAGMLVALLGVLKAGGAYVPLDPSYPQDRQAYMLRDSGARVLLTESSLWSRWAEVESSGVRVVDVETESLLIAECSSSPPQSGLSSQNAAYVIYTSGSTGLPKGTVVAHRSVVNFLYAMQAHLALGEADRFFAVTRISFDIAVLELYLPLSTGGTVVLSPDLATASLSFRDTLAHSQATAMQTTPSGWRFALGTGWDGTPPMRLLCGGEALECDLARELLARGTSLWNVYGPTETTVWSCIHSVREPSEHAVPIGLPLANTQLYVLDAEGTPVPLGVAGELYIGGDGLARGYLDRPALTAERFVPDPFASIPGMRMYRTGDLVRRDAKGDVIFLGRADQQVKLRGFRIELGEIESALREYPSVREAAAKVFANAADGQSLVAYHVVLDGAVAPSAQDLRRHLKDRLPDYMIPTAFVALDALPQTPNGKLDRRALPEPVVDAGIRPDYAAPRTPTEELLADVIAGILNLPRFGIHDDFFEAGGHSLLAIQVVSKISQIFQATIPVRALFDYPTVAELAPQIQTLRGEAAPWRPIERVERNGPLPPSYNQDGRLMFEWFAGQRMQRLRPAMLSLGLYFDGPLDVQTLELALNDIVARHESLRTCFPDPYALPPREEAAIMRRLRDPDALGRVLFELRIDPDARLAIETRAAAPGQDESAAVRDFVREATAAPFRHDRAPLMRASLMTLRPGRHLLVLVIDHLVCDAWSLRVMRRELQTFYALRSGLADAGMPEPLAVQALDFGIWQREELRIDRNEAMVEYWKREAAEYGSTRLRPADFPAAATAGDVRALSEYSASIAIDAEGSVALKDVCRRHNLTPYMLCLGAVALLLHGCSGSHRIPVWGMWANRARPESEGLIAWLADVRVLGMTMSPTAKLMTFFDHVRDVVLKANAHQDVPVGLLTSLFFRERTAEIDSDAVADVSFDMIVGDRDSAPVRIGELAVSLAELPSRATARALDLLVTDLGDRLTLFCKFDTDRFSHPQVARLLQDWRTLLAHIAESPDARVATLLASLADDVEG